MQQKRRQRSGVAEPAQSAEDKENKPTSAEKAAAAKAGKVLCLTIRAAGHRATDEPMAGYVHDDILLVIHRRAQVPSDMKSLLVVGRQSAVLPQISRARRRRRGRRQRRKMVMRRRPGTRSRPSAAARLPPSKQRPPEKSHRRRQPQSRRQEVAQDFDLFKKTSFRFAYDLMPAGQAQ